MCAGDENRFWDYHDMLFANWNGENQGAFSDKRLVAFAEAIGLDMPAFNACFDATLHEAEINTDLELARNSGVTGTPSVMVNGRIISPGFVPSFQQISDVVEAELANSGN
jgi:protein-disulfide isomerase